MKFDSEGFEVFSAPRYEGNHAAVIATYLYATKPDGTAWVSDTEMDEAVESDLIYYKTLDEVPNGYHVIGILAEFRSDIQRLSGGWMVFDVWIRVKDDAEVKKVYQIVERSKFWLKAQYDEAGGNIPRRYDEGAAVIYPTPFRDDYSPYPYVKAIYNDEGIHIGGTIYDSQTGGSIYITRYRVEIEKEIAQKEAGVEKSIYNLDSGERFVDFRLKPSFITNITGQDIKSDVMIKEVLPKGLSYITGSAYIGGTYTQNPLAGRKGTVTGGESLDPVSVDYDPLTEETTITWLLQNVNVINGPMPEIIFSAYIEDEVVNNQILLSKVSISATEDSARDKTMANRNYDEVTFRAAKLRYTSLIKQPYSRVVEVGEDVGWKAYVSNNGIDPISDAIILDVLPYNGDAGGSSIDSTTQVIIDEWSIDIINSTIENLNDWQFFYTTDTTVWSTLSKDYKAVDIRNGSSTLENGNIVNWTEVPINLVSGQISGLVNNITAVVALGTLDGGKTLVQDISLKSTNPSLKGGDVFVNSLSRGENEIYSPVDIIQRNIEGLMWEDANDDGIRQLNEELFEVGTVNLLVLNAITGEYQPYIDSRGNAVSVALGRQIDIISGVVSNFEAGKYRFLNLPAGVYGVRFTTTYIQDYLASDQNVGSDYTDSDAAGEYVDEILTSTIITGISLPEKSDMYSGRYSSMFNDSGLRRRKINIEGVKTWIDNDDELGRRPTQIIIRLINGNNNQEVAFRIVTENDNWTWVFEGVPQYGNGALINYIIVEDPIIDYESEINGYNVTNTYAPKQHLPKTGDYFNPTIWVVLLVVSFTSLIGLIIYKKKKYQ